MTEVAPHPGHILLVVCQASDRQVLAAMLREGGYRVTSVAPGPEALQALGEAAPDLVVRAKRATSCALRS
jgi:CheY-like chemotaxis protein